MESISLRLSMKINNINLFQHQINLPQSFYLVCKSIQFLSKLFIFNLSRLILNIKLALIIGKIERLRSN